MIQPFASLRGPLIKPPKRLNRGGGGCHTKDTGQAWYNPVQATPMSKQHQALVTSISAPWILAVHFFHGSPDLLCVLSDALLLRCMMFIFCVREADWGMMAFVASFAPWSSELYTMSFRMYHAQ